ncbi:histone deacetylase [Novimethylophilus kurashikiensis]|uniref:Histone deacetylase n=1 Tax=Novimethylophilus kurashikiensis TaxID=1825523 RepID=A0A2R5F8J5_9PROT|nr:histone deacetylase family protein [Novimethylophilus kurashikiensis]GBG12954.1 histone deacetylase [Novimethylophilus kurashikiensis]
MPTAFISHPDTLLHVMDGHHPESPARISAIKDRLMAAHIYDYLQHHDAPAATDEQLERVHDREYVRRIRNLAPPAGIVHLDQDTAMGPMTLTAIQHAAGAVTLGVDLVMTGKARSAFCCVRPPGHHAGRAHAGGFCIFNNVAVGVAHAMAVYGIQRAAIIDFDVHHGDGTEDIFRDNPKVMLCSTFQSPLYPFRGEDSRTERIINVPLPSGTDGKQFRAVVEKEFAPALDEFAPELIFISAGFDAHLDDPLGGMRLVRDDYIWVTEFVMDVAQRHAQGRIVSSLEGGYDLTSLADAAAAHVRTLSGL